MTLKQMEALVWLSRLGRFDRAAMKLNITQSTMSKRIQELETAVGFALIDRSAREARLTAKGEHLVLLGDELLKLQDQAMSLKDAGETPARRLRFGVTELSAFTWLPRLASFMRDRYPTVLFEPEVDLSRHLYQKLQDGVIDVIIAPEAFRSPEITSVPLSEIESMWVASSALVGASRKLSYDELSRHTFLTQGRKSGSGLIVDKWMKENGIVLPRQMTCDSLVAIIGLTVAGIGVSYLPRQCFSPLLKNRKLVRIETELLLPSIMYAAMFRNDQPSRFILDVVTHTKDLCDFTRQLQ